MTNKHEALDAVDRRILEQLQREARLTNTALAERVGMAASPCLRRVKALEERGVLRGYRALVDRHALGHEIEALAFVRLSQSDEGWRTRLIGRLQAARQVVSCIALTGEYDLLLRVVAPDIESYGEFVMNELLALPGVADVRSSFVLSVIKPDLGWPV